MNVGQLRELLEGLPDEMPCHVFHKGAKACSNKPLNTVQTAPFAFLCRTEGRKVLAGIILSDEDDSVFSKSPKPGESSYEKLPGGGLDYGGAHQIVVLNGEEADRGLRFGLVLGTERRPEWRVVRTPREDEQEGAVKKVYMVMEEDWEYGYALLCTGQVYSSKEAAEAAKAELDKVAPTTSDKRFVREFDVLEGADAAKAAAVTDARDGHYRAVTIEVAY